MKRLICAVVVSGLLIATLATMVFAGSFRGAPSLKVPVSKLDEVDDSCRSWLLVFADETRTGENSNFLLDSVRAFGLGSGVRTKHITPKMESAWKDWAPWHQNKPTILTLSPDGKRVMSIVRAGGGTVNVNGTILPVPDLPPATLETVDRQIELAGLLVLEDPEGKRGRLFDPNSPPYWLPYRRWEVWSQRCPKPKPDDTTQPPPVDTVAQPEIDPELLAALTGRDEVPDSGLGMVLVAVGLGGLLAVPAGYLVSRVVSSD